ncbi:Uncharacterized protein Adt_04047 [Abeliophyllum distichum]|uniref:Uncharacterized protein n=1 Tax=Abeliophyllum distichum TaxID=126358 RepID=A0ABD1W085_9LAMI
MNVIVLDSSSKVQTFVTFSQLGIMFDSFGSIESLGALDTKDQEPALEQSVMTSCLDCEVIEASKDKSPKSLERSIVEEEMRRIEETGRLLQEKEETLQESLRTISDLENMGKAMEGRLQRLVRVVEEQEESLKWHDERI